MNDMSSRHDVTFENLPTINRNLIVIEPTAVFLDWARGFPGDPSIGNISEVEMDIAINRVVGALRVVAPRREAERDPELMRISSLQKASV
jgi:hypothetical protein